MSLSALVLRYALFAVIATLANLGTQRLVLAIVPDRAGASLAFAAALALGTLAGLVVKYVLDKRWIFFDAGQGLKDHGRKFSLYTAMGLVTTAIFWGSETLGWMIWHSTFAREAGAIAGLAVGYVVKYRLDRRFVFTGRAIAR